MKSSFICNPSKRYPSCHASTICELPNGELLSSWFAGSKEGAEDTVLLASRLNLNGETWSDPFILVNVAHHASGNPRLFIGPDKAVWLLAPVNYGYWCKGGTRLFLKRSYDNGNTWTDLELFIEEKGILGKNKPIRLKSNPKVWLIPAEYERNYIGTFIRTNDNGKNWEVVGEIGRGNNIRIDQPTVVELDNGELLAYTRSWEGKIYQTRSSDQGKTWTDPEPTLLLNNNSGIDMIKLKSGTMVLVFNPVGLGESGDIVVDQALKEIHSKKYSVANFSLSESDLVKDSELTALFPRWGPRTPLSIAVSKDDGESWTVKKDLESGKGEYSYPSIMQAANGRIHIVYTFKRTHIKHVCLEENKLSQ